MFSCSTPFTVIFGNKIRCPGSVSIVTDSSITGNYVTCDTPFFLAGNSGTVPACGASDQNHYNSLLDIPSDKYLLDGTSFTLDANGKFQTINGFESLPVSSYNFNSSTGTPTNTVNPFNGDVSQTLDPSLYAMTFVGFFTLFAVFRLTGIAISQILRRLN